MDLRKFGKKPKKVLSAEHVLGMVKPKKKTKKKVPKKSKKDKPKKGKPKKDKPKSILSKTLKRATTTEQSIRNDTQQQFLQNLHGRLNNNDGRTNGIWNSYKRNITAQSFGGTPYEMYRLQEESTILREMLERATNDGRRRRPQVSTTETQTDTQQPRDQPTTPPTTPPPVQSPQQGGGLRPSNLGFGQIQPRRRNPPPITPFTGSPKTIGGAPPVPIVPTGALSLWSRTPTVRANVGARTRESTPSLGNSLQDRRHNEALNDLVDDDLLDYNRYFESDSTRGNEVDDQAFLNDLNEYIAEDNAKFAKSAQVNKRFEDVTTDEYRQNFDKSQMNKRETQQQRDYDAEEQRILNEGEPPSSQTGKTPPPSPPPSEDEKDDNYDPWATDDEGDIVSDSYADEGY